jgi:hypothetical protein
MEDTRFRDILTPWDAGVRIEIDPVPVRDLVGPYPVVRWTDRWRTRWEHKRGEIKQVIEGRALAPLA